MNIATKLEQLEAQLDKGKSYLLQLQMEMNNTQITVSRIEGAIQCCKDLMTSADAEGVDLPPPADVATMKSKSTE